MGIRGDTRRRKWEREVRALRALGTGKNLR